jgi:hypothetical protein
VIEASRREDRRAAWIIFLTSFLAYSYFFQGVGWNQLAHFSTMRSLAEHGTADISAFTDLTGDYTAIGTAKYSSKPPGIALLGTPFYFVLMNFERWIGWDIGAESVWLKNLHVVTILLSALPGAILNVLIFYAFRREGALPRTAMLLAGAYAFGSLSWPYSGVLMAHLMCAVLIFAVWYLLSENELTIGRCICAGALAGLSILCDLFMAPLAGVFALYLVARKSGTRNLAVYCLGPIGSAPLILLYNRIAQGNALSSGPFHPTPEFTAPGLLFGLFDWPEWRRLYWITYQPMRGIFVCCPIFLICLMSLLLIRRREKIRLDRRAILLIVLLYVVFYLTYYTWTGGWSVGLRFAIPALPLIWIFAHKPFERFPRVCALLIVLSMVHMISVTSVRVLYPGPGTGPPNSSDPIRACLIVFLQGRTNTTDNGYNLGELAGVWERFQLLPIYLLLTIFYTYAFTRPNRQSAGEAVSSRGFQLEKQ